MTTSKNHRTVHDLSFVGKRINPGQNELPLHWWRVHASGDHATDCKTGERLALEYLAFEESDPQGPGHLQLIVRDMPRDLTGVEVGFLTMVAFAAGAGAQRARNVASYWQAKSGGMRVASRLSSRSSL